MNARFGWLLSLILLAGCSKKPVAIVEVESRDKASTDFRQLKSVLVGIQPGEVLLYEGLPSNFWEPEVRESELRQKQTTRVHGHPLYAELLTLPKDEADQLTALFAAKDSYQAYSGTKPCGDFQPDYVVEWKRSGGASHALISLECGEVQLFGPSAHLHCDLSPAVTEKLKQRLAPHRKNRPAPAATGS